MALTKSASDPHIISLASAKYLEQNFPFSVVIATDSTIISAGRSLQKLLKDVKGKRFSEVLSIIRPTNYLDGFEGIVALQNTLVILAVKNRSDIIFRGQFIHIAEINTAVFIGSPLITEIEKLNELQLKIGDFSFFDAIPDMLQLANMRKVANEDNEVLFRKLKKEQQIARANEKFYKTIVNSINEIVFRTDKEGNWSFLNPAWESIMGYTIEECIGRSLFEFLHPEDVAKNHELFLPLINREKPYCQHKIRYVTKSKEIKWIRVYASLLYSDDNSVIGTTGTLSDITLEEQRQHDYELISNHVQDLICIHETDGRYLYVSPSIKQISSFLPEEMIGRSPFDFFHKDDQEAIQLAFVKMLEKKSKTADIITYRFKTKKGNYRWLETNYQLLWDAYLGREVILTTSRTIDERKAAEEKIMLALKSERQINQLKTRFVSMISHEIRTPLSIISLNAEALRLYTDALDDKIRKVVYDKLSEIDDEINTLTGLINEVLTVGKIENNNIEAKKKPGDILELLQQKVDKHNQLSENRKISITTQGEPFPIHYDASLIKQVFDNLISNALKYSPDKPSPEIHIAFTDAACMIEVKDHGIGIPKYFQKNLFNTFQRADNTENIRGNGLGLFIVKQFLDLHKASITCESVLNQGTTFTVTFPSEQALHN